jgi:hypothetical protein
MQFIALFAGLVFFFAGSALWLLANASQPEIERRHPKYAKAIFRTRAEGIMSNGGPVKAWSLLVVKPPSPQMPSITPMRTLAATLFVSALVSGICWTFS